MVRKGRSGLDRSTRGLLDQRPGQRGGRPFALILFACMLGAALIAPGGALARHRATEHRALANADAGGSKATETYAAGCVMEPTTGAVIFEKDMHKPWPTASLTKMMLMLIAAEKLHDGSLKLGDQVTTSHKAAKMGGSQVYLKEGETFSLEDMMKAIVIHSANDASVAVAEYIAGSTDAFVQLMNQTAARLGMKDTHYYSVHGLPPAPGQTADVSSAYDCAILGRELVKYPQILKWSSIDTTTFRHGTFELRNTNHLVRTCTGCDGLKTGFYYKAGFNVVATAHRNGMRIIAVVLGSPHKQQNFDDAAALLSQGFLNYEMYQVAKKATAITEPLAVNGGAVASVKPVWGTDLSMLLKRDADKKAVKVTYQLPPSVAAPVKAGQQVGEGEALLDGKPAASAPLLAPADIPRASLLQRVLSGM